jgi:hypothetical protein
MLLEFKSFVKQTLYVSRPLINFIEVRQHFIEQGFNTTINDMHVTICYSKQPVKWNEFEEQTNDIKILNESGRKMEKFGEAYVMTFKSYELEKRHKVFINKGASSDFPEYRSHITVSYTKPKVDFSSIKPFEGVLMFGPEKFKKIDLNWKQKVKSQEY